MRKLALICCLALSALAAAKKESPMAPALVARHGSRTIEVPLGTLPFDFDANPPAAALRLAPPPDKAPVPVARVEGASRYASGAFVLDQVWRAAGVDVSTDLRKRAGLADDASLDACADALKALAKAPDAKADTVARLAHALAALADFAATPEGALVKPSKGYAATQRLVAAGFACGTLPSFARGPAERDFGAYPRGPMFLEVRPSFSADPWPTVYERAAQAIEGPAPKLAKSLRALAAQLRRELGLASAEPDAAALKPLLDAAEAGGDGAPRVTPLGGKAGAWRARVHAGYVKDTLQVRFGAIPQFVVKPPFRADEDQQAIFLDQNPVYAVPVFFEVVTKEPLTAERVAKARAQAADLAAFVRALTD